MERQKWREKDKNDRANNKDNCCMICKLPSNLKNHPKPRKQISHHPIPPVQKPHDGDHPLTFILLSFSYLLLCYSYSIYIYIYLLFFGSCLILGQILYPNMTYFALFWVFSSWSLWAVVVWTSCRNFHIFLLLVTEKSPCITEVYQKKWFIYLRKHSII